MEGAGLTVKLVLIPIKMEIGGGDFILCYKSLTRVLASNDPPVRDAGMHSQSKGGDCCPLSCL